MNRSCKTTNMITWDTNWSVAFGHMTSAGAWESRQQLGIFSWLDNERRTCHYLETTFLQLLLVRLQHGSDELIVCTWYCFHQPVLHMHAAVVAHGLT